MSVKNLKIIMICLILGASLSARSMVWAGDGEPFFARIMEIDDSSMTVEVFEPLSSNHAIGQILSLTITENTVFQNHAFKKISSKAFQKGVSVQIKPTVLQKGKMRADSIIMDSGR